MLITELTSGCFVSIAASERYAHAKPKYTISDRKQHLCDAKWPLPQKRTHDRSLKCASDAKLKPQPPSLMGFGVVVSAGSERQAYSYLEPKQALLKADTRWFAASARAFAPLTF